MLKGSKGLKNLKFEITNFKYFTLRSSLFDLLPNLIARDKLTASIRFTEI